MMPEEDVVKYKENFGFDPVAHQGRNPDGPAMGIAPAIEDMMKDLNIPQRARNVSEVKNQALILELRKLYSENSKFKHLNCWPAVRDWLHKNLKDTNLVIPD